MFFPVRKRPIHAKWHCSVGRRMWGGRHSGRVRRRGQLAVVGRQRGCEARIRSCRVLL